MDLIDQYREMHRQGKFRGFSALPHAGAIGQLVKKHKAKSILDYGSGKGHQYSEMGMHRNWGQDVVIRCYDPAWPAHEEKPIGRFDGVVCTDVAEHIPEENIGSFLDDVIGYAVRFLYMNICTRPARKRLLDGRNAHLTVRESDWWMGQIQSRVPDDVELRIVFEM